MLYLTEEDVRALIDVEAAIPITREAIGALGRGAAMNIPRSRAKAPGIVLHNMHAAAEYLGVVGAKLYTTTKGGAQFWVMLFSAESGDLLAMIEADYLGQLRTAAASAVATDLMARADATTLGVIGAGTQAAGQIEAICAVRPIETIRVYSRTPEKREAFAQELGASLKRDVQAVDTAERAVAGMHVIVTATTSRTPVCEGRWLTPGAHLNVIGSNDLRRAEIDMETVARANKIVCDSKEACRIEAGDFTQSIIAGVVHYDAMFELSDLINGHYPGRTTEEEITLFKSVGLAIEDIALGHAILERAETAGVGRRGF